MRLHTFLNRLNKLSQAMASKRLRHALFRHRVLAGAEHRRILSRDLKTVVDIGANRGQFALAVRRWAPAARVISFEPLDKPSVIFRRVFFGDPEVTLHQSAIGPKSVTQEMHVSARDDSSSLLPISELQSSTFPGTEEVATVAVNVAPLHAFVNEQDLSAPAMLKLDVQGYELEALQGCEVLLDRFDWVYCECSFVEFYAGQKLAGEVVDWLQHRGYHLTGQYNRALDANGQTMQADFLFKRMEVQP